MTNVEDKRCPDCSALFGHKHYLSCPQLADPVPPTSEVEHADGQAIDPPEFAEVDEPNLEERREEAVREAYAARPDIPKVRRMLAEAGFAVEFKDDGHGTQRMIAAYPGAQGAEAIAAAYNCLTMLDAGERQDLEEAVFVGEGEREYLQKRVDELIAEKAEVQTMLEDQCAHDEKQTRTVEMLARQRDFLLGYVNNLISRLGAAHVAAGIMEASAHQGFTVKESMPLQKVLNEIELAYSQQGGNDGKEEAQAV